MRDIPYFINLGLGRNRARARARCMCRNTHTVARLRNPAQSCNQKRARHTLESETIPASKAAPRRIIFARSLRNARAIRRDRMPNYISPPDVLTYVRTFGDRQTRRCASILHSASFWVGASELSLSFRSFRSFQPYLSCALLAFV